MGYLNEINQIDRLLTIYNSDEYIINGFINISYEDRKKINKLLFEVNKKDALSYYLNRLLGNSRKVEIEDGLKKLIIRRDDEYKIYIIIESNEIDLDNKFKLHIKGNYLLYKLFEDINDNLNVDNHQITIDEYLYSRKLEK